jgi:AraC family transcriptional regulator
VVRRSAARSWAGFGCLRDTSALTIEQLLVESFVLLADDAHPRTTRFPPLTRVLERLRDELHRTPSLDELARLAGLHPTHMARAFRRRFGCPIGEWLRRERVQRALIAIGNSDRPLSLIALDCGFSDQAHLSRVFRQHLGLPPGRLRRALRDRSNPAGFVAGAHPFPRR